MNKGQNPNQDFVRLNVEFLKNRQSTQTIRYPTIDVIKNFVSRTSDFCQDDVRLNILLFFSN
jgi:5-methylcytosine-specific restriction endonuclease McrA